MASAAGIVNRPPNAITLSFDPAAPRQAAVLFCRVGTSLTLDDPDYDVVRYRYEWRIDSVLVRDVTHAGQADALARDVLASGEDVECRVTPSDGTVNGPVASLSSGVGPPCTGGCVFSDDLETGTTALWSATVP